MKLPLLLLGIILLGNCTYIEPSSKELIVNGDFSTNDCRSQWCIFNKDQCVPGWIPDPQLQIGYGYLYSNSLQKERVLQLAPNSNSCVKQRFQNFQSGVYRLKISYGARKQRSFQDCQFSVSFNGDVLKSIKPTCYDVQTQVIQFTVKASCAGELKFCGIGGQKNSYGAFLKSVSLVKVRDFQIPLPNPPTPQKPQNGQLILNGDFSTNDCRSQWCIFNQQKCVPGWIPDPQIQIGFGYIYSDYLQKQRVLQLAPNYNSCVKQQIKNFEAGNYQLTVSYAARKQRSFQDCQFSVSFNGQTLKSIKPTCYDVQTDVIQFTVRNPCDIGQIKFCGIGGENNSYGAIISSVSLIRKRIALPQPPINNPPLYPFPIPVPQPPIVGIPNINPQPLPLTPPVNNQGLYLNSHSNQCFQRQYQLQGGEHQITFDYKVLSPWPVKQSFIVINFNGKVVSKVYPCDDGKNIKIIVNAQQGLNTLVFCPSGFQGQNQHQILISNVVFYRKQCEGRFSNDLIVNGGFQTNECKSDWCIWNRNTCKQDSVVPGWIASPQIEVGKGTIYNKVLGNSWVSELDPNANSCIRQNLQLKNGKYVLNFDWAARSGVDASSNTFEVKLNGQCLRSYWPKDCDLHKQKIEFTASQNSGAFLQFCGTGKNDSLGALIDNVQLFYFDECASFSWVKC